ncbi:MAG: HAD-IA family hydrolase, partial [Bacteroidota bacterium]
MMHQKYILLDVAETLLHKPLLWERYGEVLAEYGYEVADLELKKKHRLLSEAIQFPDVTTRAFYEHFNRKLLESLDIVSTPELLNRIYEACKGLPWEPFDDTSVLQALPNKMGILSNFHSGLRRLLNEKLPELVFNDIFISEELAVAKPDVRFFEHALSVLGLEANQVIYVGDSMKLDIVPAL